MQNQVNLTSYFFKITISLIWRILKVALISQMLHDRVPNNISGTIPAFTGYASLTSSTVKTPDLRQCFISHVSVLYPDQWSSSNAWEEVKRKPFDAHAYSSWWCEYSRITCLPTASGIVWHQFFWGYESFRMPQTNGSLTSGHSSSANSSSSEASEARQSLSKKENIICTEVFDENSSPTKDGEIGNYYKLKNAKKLSNWNS